MDLLLDTCTLIWAVSDPGRLSSPAADALAAANNRVHVSVMSCAEVACLAESGRITVRPHWRRWFDTALAENGWPALSIDLQTVQEAFSLPGEFHRDPVDRLIVAAARLCQMHIVTADHRIRAYPHVRAIW